VVVVVNEPAKTEQSPAKQKVANGITNPNPDIFDDDFVPTVTIEVDGETYQVPNNARDVNKRD
jgi:hypothetical protein